MSAQQADSSVCWKERYWIKFPYHQFVDRASIYKGGSLLYAIYYLISFPSFLRTDEKPGYPWDLARVAIDALGAAMLITIILHLWRISLGPIVPVSETKHWLQPGLPWFRGHANETWHHSETRTWVKVSGCRRNQAL